MGFFGDFAQWSSLDFWKVKRCALDSTLFCGGAAKNQTEISMDPGELRKVRKVGVDCATPELTRGGVPPPKSSFCQVSCEKWIFQLILKPRTPPKTSLWQGIFRGWWGGPPPPKKPKSCTWDLYPPCWRFFSEIPHRASRKLAAKCQLSKKPEIPGTAFDFGNVQTPKKCVSGKKCAFFRVFSFCQNWCEKCRKVKINAG